MLASVFVGISSTSSQAYSNGSYYFKNSVIPTYLYVIRTKDMTVAEKNMITSLEGIIANQSTSLIYVADEGSDYQTWLDDLKDNYGVNYEYVTDPWALLDRFKSYVNGYVLYTDNSNPSAKPSAQSFEAEGTQLGHNVGRADGTGYLAGWSANTAQDSAGHMVFGPYATNIPTGANTAYFNMMIDNNTADSDTVAVIDVRDATTGIELASKNIARTDFSATNTYMNFSLDFNNNTAGHSIEFRVWWTDKAYIRVDKISVEAKRNTDPSINNASTYSGVHKYIIAEQSIEQQVINHGISARMDCRNTNEAWAYNNLWNQVSHSMVIELGPGVDYNLRDYAIMSKALVFYESNPSVTTLRDQIYGAMDPDSVVLGWGPDEGNNVSAGSRAGVSTIAADWAANLSVLSAFPSNPIAQKAEPVPAVENNVHYVTFLMSDGDNLQWNLGGNYGSPKWFGSSNRGNFNLGWAMPPSMYDLAPTVLKRYYQDANKDNYIVAPSGGGYMYPAMYNQTELDTHVQRLNDYMGKMDQKYVSIIDSASFNNTSLWNKYTAQPNIGGLFYLEFAPHNYYGGQINWSNNKPIVSCRDLLWQGLEDNDQLVNSITNHVNAANGTNIYNAGAYSMVYIHVWSKTLDDVQEVVNQLNQNSKIRIVTPDTFMTLVKRNLTPGTHDPLFSSGFESGDTATTWSDTIDVSHNVSGYFSNINPECSIRTGEFAKTGSSAIMYSGTDNSTSSSYCYSKVFDVNIPITADTKLSYWNYPQSENGRYAAVDFICTDGTTLRDSGAVDQNGVSMHPNAGHGTINTWTNITSNIGQYLNGKTIDRISIGYDQPGGTGQYRGYIDDICITNY